MSNKKSLILHIGSPKTGTSSIQSHLKQNAELLEENGYYYLGEKFQWHDGAHHLLGFALREKPYGGQNFNLKDTLLNLKNELKGIEANKVIISSELLFYDIQPQKENFEALFSLFDKVTIVCFLRNPIHYLESLFKQMVRDPNDSLTSSPGEFFTNHKKSIHYVEILNSYMGLYNELKVFDFEKEKPLLQSFYKKVLSIDFTETEEKRKNISLDGPILKLKHYYNKKIKRFEDNKMVLNKLLEFDKEFKIPYKKIEIFSLEEKKAIANYFTSTNQTQTFVLPGIDYADTNSNFQLVSSEVVQQFESFFPEVKDLLQEKG